MSRLTAYTPCVYTIRTITSTGNRGRPHPSAETRQASRIDPDTYRAGQKAVWIPDESLGHPYERLIRLWCYTGDTVLNPISGQGPIALCARNLKRRCVTPELREDNCRHIASLLAIGH